MKAYLFSYTVKVISSGFKTIKIKHKEYFISKQLFYNFLNHKNIHSEEDIYCWDKSDKEFNRIQIKKLVRPGSVVWMTKYTNKLII